MKGGGERGGPGNKRFTLLLACMVVGWGEGYIIIVLPKWLNGKESTSQCANAQNIGSIPGSGRSPREGTGYPLQYFRLENSMDRGETGGLESTVSKSQTQLSIHTLLLNTHLFHLFGCTRS